MIAWITIKYTWKRKIIIPNASMSLKFIDLLWPILFASYKSCDRNANTISIKKERKFILILMIAWIFIKSKKYTYQMLQVHQFTLIWDKIYITGTFRIRFWWLYNKYINRGKNQWNINDCMNDNELFMKANKCWSYFINKNLLHLFKVLWTSGISFQLYSVIFSLGDDSLSSGYHFVEWGLQ